jgi:hypothetical protein
MPWFVVYADDDLELDYGAAPAGRNSGIVTIEVRAEASTRCGGSAAGYAGELIRDALLRGQGFDATLSVTNGSTHAVPTDGSLTFYPGFLVRGPGIPDHGDFVGIATVNDDGSVELSAPYGGSDGDVSFNIGSFVALFEQITKVKSFPEYKGTENKKHIATDTVEFHGYVHETFEPAITQPLNEIKLWVDSAPIPFPPQTIGSVEPQE